MDKILDCFFGHGKSVLPGGILHSRVSLLTNDALDLIDFHSGSLRNFFRGMTGGQVTNGRDLGLYSQD